MALRTDSEWPSASLMTLIQEWLKILQLEILASSRHNGTMEILRAIFWTESFASQRIYPIDLYKVKRAIFTLTNHLMSKVISSLMESILFA